MMVYKVDKLVDHAALTLTDHNGIVNGSNTFIKKLSVTANGRQVYDCDYANHCLNIKNLLEYNPSYAKSVGTNEFYFPDASSHADEIKYTRRQVTHRRNAANNGDEAGLMLDDFNVNYNKGFAARKALLGLSAKVNCEIPLNRYSFFEALEDKLLPNTKIDLSIEFDDDKNLIWRQGAADAAGTSYRLIIKRLQQIRKVAKHGGNLFSSLTSLGARVLSYAVKGLSKAVPALATGAVSALGSLGIAKIFGKGIDIPKKFFPMLPCIVNELTKSQIDQINKVTQTGGRLVLKPTRKQIEGGFLGTLASIGIPMAIRLVTKMLGGGLQVDKAPSTKKK